MNKSSVDLIEMFLYFVKSEINFLAITTWENEDVMRKWDVVFRSNRFQAQLVAVSSERGPDQWEGLIKSQWPIREWLWWPSVIQDSLVIAQTVITILRGVGAVRSWRGRMWKSYKRSLLLSWTGDLSTDRDRDLAQAGGSAIDIQMFSSDSEILFS